MPSALQENRKHQSEILEILVHFWNPCDLPHEQAVCDYENEVPDIYRQILAGVSQEELARHLLKRDAFTIETERFDPARWKVAELVANKLLNLDIRK